MSRDNQASPSKEFFSEEARKKVVEDHGPKADLSDVEKFALSDLRHRLRTAVIWGFTEREALEVIKRASEDFFAECKA